MTEIFEYGQATLLLGDCLTWLGERAERSIHAVVTDPPYGLLEYTAEQKAKLRAGRGGVWRIPPSYRRASAFTVAQVHRADQG